ncbi:eamA-like transporter family protein [Collimonas arenae]|uniref:EamA-like transporter family protein n=1 Tax=Collimonas arenae TaxID=279058 RepID=A0A127PNX5_9BURK|nr:EamA family transporter [Collimonas arenae]AMO99452.1 eamA-like transporter family protein [Collimonas arenae]AMP09353.1 eamA-like transporter family protein [Collimonas arenae]
MTKSFTNSSVKSLWVADLLLLLVAIVWGTSYGVAKEALAYYPVMGFLAIRFCMTFLLLLPTLHQLARPEGRAALRAGLPLGLILLAILICETFGVALTRASNAAFLISLCVVFTPFVEWLVMRQRPGGSAFLVAFVSLFGTWLLTSGSNLTFNLGDGLMVAAALLRALMVCMTKRLTLDKNMATLTLTAVQSGVVGIGSLIVAGVFAQGGLPPLPTDSDFWFGTIYLVLFCTIFAFFAQNYGVRRTNPTRVSLLMGSEPVFGALFAALWLGEKLSTMSWIGGALIVGATLWATLPRTLFSLSWIVAARDIKPENSPIVGAGIDPGQ